MSLVNKMLRDLDARRAGAGDRAAFPAAVTPLAAHREPGRGKSHWWPGVVLVTAVLGAAAWYGAQPGQPAARPPAAAPAVPVTPAAMMPAAAPTAPEPVSVQAFAPLAGLPPLRMTDQLSGTPDARPGAKPAAAPRATSAATPVVTSAVASAAASVPKPTPAVPNTPERPLAGDAPSRSPITLPPVPVDTRIDKQMRLPTPAERAESEYRRAVLAQRQGNLEHAAVGYRTALEDYPEHAAARQTLAALLIDAKRFDEAEELLRQGTELASVRLASTLALARLKVERNQGSAALDLLQRNAASGERSAEYQGFLGALLNRANRSAEAVERYQAATRLAPNEGRWWAGLGMALDAAGKAPEAREAYQRARTLPGLPVDLAQHVEQRLR